MVILIVTKYGNRMDFRKNSFLVRLVEQKTGVHYALYAYDGHPEAEYVIVVMGSGAVTCSETAKYLQEKGEKACSLKDWGDRLGQRVGS